MVKIELGDIVRVDGFSSSEYFMITDITDFSREDDFEPSLEYEIMLIYPVGNDDIYVADEDEIRIYSKVGSKEHSMIINHIETERKRNNLFDIPRYLRRLEQTIDKDKNRPTNERINKTKIVRFGEKEIREILANRTTDKKMDSYIEKLDNHLKLLGFAINNNDKDDIEFQKSQLEKVRKELLELEYFQMAERRAGTSIKVK